MIGWPIYGTRLRYSVHILFRRILRSVRELYITYIIFILFNTCYWYIPYCTVLYYTVLTIQYGQYCTNLVLLKSLHTLLHERADLLMCTLLSFHLPSLLYLSCFLFHHDHLTLTPVYDMKKTEPQLSAVVSAQLLLSSLLRLRGITETEPWLSFMVLD